MVRILVTPTWAKLIDFETTLPSAVGRTWSGNAKTVAPAERRSE
jgi:hypothetical protein